MAADTQILITSDRDVVAARQQGRAVALRTGFSMSEATLIATAISELARNIVSYANQGSVTLRPVYGSNGAIGLTIVASDSGPGIADVTLALRDDLVERVGRLRSRGVVVDVTVLDVMDSFAARTLRDMARMIRLRGARTVIVGIQPEVAFAMVQLGLTLEDIPTALDLEEGLAYLQQKARSIN